MARFQFFHHEKGSYPETWYYLNKTADGRAVIERETCNASGEIVGPHSIEIVDFLTNGHGYAQYDLLRLIGTLVPDDGGA